MLDIGRQLPTKNPGIVSAWAHFADLDTWIWQPRVIAYGGDVDTVQRLRAEGYEQIDAEHHEARLTSLFGQLANVVTLVWPGAGTRRDRWALREDIERADAMPVCLGFTIPDGAPLPELGQDNYRALSMAVWLPPPQLGARALILHGDKWQTRTLSLLGETGLNLWRQMGAALTQLNAPAEWWMYSQELELCGIPAEYQVMRDRLRSRLLATRGQEREAVREQLASLERMRKNAEKLRKVREREANDKGAWLAQWQEVQRMAQELAALYWQADQLARTVPAVSLPTNLDTDIYTDAELPTETAATLDPDLQASIDIISRISEVNSAKTLTTTTYQEDRAVREASLSDKAEWREEGGMPRYDASNGYAVYYGDPEHPMALEDAQAKLLDISERTILTQRIVSGLWNIRRHDGQLARNGSAGVRVDEVLQWRGVAKMSRPAYPGASHSVTEGYRAEHKEQVRQDLMRLNHLYIRGQHVVKVKGKARTVTVQGPYWRVSSISAPTLWSTEEVVGFMVSPGDWINTYEDYGNYYLTEVDRRVFQLNPQNEQHELRIAFYLVELWREQAKHRAYSEAITMRDLLRKSVIPVDTRNLTNRFVPRIEGALENLRQHGIIGAYECLTPVDRNKGRWGQDWLAARWRISPPGWLIQSLEKITRQAPPALPKPNNRA